MHPHLLPILQITGTHTEKGKEEAEAIISVLKSVLQKRKYVQTKKSGNPKIIVSQKCLRYEAWRGQIDMFSLPDCVQEIVVCQGERHAISLRLWSIHQEEALSQLGCFCKTEDEQTMKALAPGYPCSSLMLSY